MQPQITHESEVHRQHVRLKIPIEAEIDGARFVVDDWSMGGFGVESEITSRQPGEKFQATLRFPFEDFDLMLRLDCQMVYILEDAKRFGCKFLTVSQGQLGLFRFLVDAYLSGEVVSGGDVLAIVQREGGGANLPPSVTDPYAAEREGGGARTWLGWAAMLAVAGVLAALIGYGVNEKYFTVRAESAVIEAPIYTIRSPLAGAVARGEPADIINPNDPLATVEGLDGSSVTLESPCVCVLLNWSVQEGQFVEPGGRVALLASADQPLAVRARVPFEEALSLEVGDVAVIEIPGRAEPYDGQIDAIDLKPQLRADASGSLIAASSERMVEVRIRPDRPFDFDDLGSQVAVRFP